MNLLSKINTNISNNKEIKLYLENYYKDKKDWVKPNKELAIFLKIDKNDFINMDDINFKLIKYIRKQKLCVDNFIQLDEKLKLVFPNKENINIFNLQEHLIPLIITQKKDDDEAEDTNLI